ncbi:integrase [Gossypium australe]|uniref:Integrase n=1 Tax=Gossypium australe TaxID=47621 RepID=A0A5B6UVG4_9ROSI|nr:integrase [Gossypium australe]
MVVNALSRKTLVALKIINVHLSLTLDGAIIEKFELKLNLLQQMQDAQELDENLMSIIKIYVPNIDDLRRDILKEAHNASYTMDSKG